MANMSPLPVSVIASAEQLGDLKLYRFPTRVTVASRGQKQVGMLSKPSIKLAPLYQSEVDEDEAGVALILRGKNNMANGLGAALPAGKVAVFGEIDGQSMLVGESSIADKTLGEDVEFNLGEPDSVKVQIKTLKDRDNDGRYRLTVTNSNPWPVDYEAKFRVSDSRLLRNPNRSLGKKDGLPLWTVRVPANGTATIDYTIHESD